MVLVCKTILGVEMKRILIPILVIVILLLSACAAPSAPPPTPAPEPAPPPAPAPTPAPPPTPPPTPTPTPATAPPTPEPQATTEWITPISAEASGYKVWGETWYTGPPELAIDCNDITAWTLDDMGEITFDLGSKRLVAGIEAYWGGHVTNGNTVNVFVDNTQVLYNERFGATSNERYFNLIQGRYIKYQTVPLPHNELLQVATWSEIAEFKVLVEKS